MKTINLLILLPVLWLTACSGTSLPGQDSPSGDPSADPSRREVRMELPGELVLPGVGTRAPLALEEEMSVAAMDVYCFGCDTDNGRFTLREKFSYRQDNSTVAGAVPMTIARSGNRVTAVLSLEKGQFVRLYCVANQPRLLRADGSEATFTREVSTEDDLTACTTDLSVLLRDTLVPPLPMAGALADVLDLTDRKATSVCVVNMPLKRLVARFDVLNYNTGTHFRLDSIGMGNGRTGATLYPVQPAGNRITYRSRGFSGTNEGMTSGAFYAYPSPEADQGYLILKGRIGDTAEPVTYRVDFRQYNPAGAGGFINIEANHRYLLQIASDEGIHFKIKDWEDVNLDDYYPDNSIRAIHFRDTMQQMNTFDSATRTVTMGWGEESGSHFFLDCYSKAGTSAVINFNGGKPWFTLTQRNDTVKDIYTVNYIDGAVPEVGATIVIRNREGVDSLVYVKPYLGGELEYEYGADNRSSDYDVITKEVVLYSQNKSRFTIKVKSNDGSRILSNLPYNLTCIRILPAQSAIIYTFLLPNSNRLPEIATIRFINKKDGSKRMNVKLRMKEMPAWYPAKPDSLVPSQYLGGMWWAPVNVAESVVWENRNVCPVGWVVPELHGDKSINACIPQTEVDFLDPPFTGRYWTNQRAEGSSWAYYVTFTDNRYTQTCDFTTNKCQIRCVKSR